ncbi:MAG: FtsX-like permease family protein, partial [Vicinamibacterales bacterium]
NARQFADRLLATRIITGFGVLAFVVAAAGIYGVMAFLVANRAREIGIRMALGADSRRIRRLVLESSMWLVFLGAAIGIDGAHPRRLTVGTITAFRRQSHGPG